MAKKYKYKKKFKFDGKDYYIYGDTLEEVLSKKITKIKELEEGKAKTTNRTVKEWSKDFYSTYKEPYVSEKSAEIYKMMINKLNSYIGNIPIKKIIASDLQTIINKEYQSGKSKSYIDKLIMVIKQIFRRAHIDKLISDDPSLSIIKPKMQGGSRRALTDMERNILLKVADSNVHGRWVRCMLFMGLRPSETALVQGKDVDVDNKLLHVRGTKTRHADRYIPIPSHIINDYKGFHKEEYIFANGNGKPNTETNRKDWWKAFKREMDIEMGATVYRNQVVESVIAKDLSMYCLRHTFGTDCQSVGLPINITRELMGHSDISITSKFYIHSSTESTEQARQALELLGGN